MTAWPMWAHRYDSGRFHTIGSKRYVELHQLAEPMFPVVVEEVDREDESGNAWGWMGFAYGWRQADTEPVMIWSSWAQFSMCFPYGPEREEQAGKGRIVRLKVRIG